MRCTFHAMENRTVSRSIAPYFFRPLAGFINKYQNVFGSKMVGRPSGEAILRTLVPLPVFRDAGMFLVFVSERELTGVPSRRLDHLFGHLHLRFRASKRSRLGAFR